MHHFLKILMIAVTSFALGMGMASIRRTVLQPDSGTAERSDRMQTGPLKSERNSGNASALAIQRLDESIKRMASVAPSVVTEVNHFMESKRRLLIFEKMAERDPREAAKILGGFENLDDRERSEFTQSLVSVWSGRDPESALSWLEGNVGGLDFKVIDRLRSLIYQYFFKVDPQGAASRLETLSDKGLREDGFYNLAEQWVTSDPAAAFAWLDSLPPSGSFYNSRDECRFQMLRHLIRLEPQAALPQITALKSQKQREALIPSAVLSLGRKDVDSAIEWVSRLKAGSEKAAGLEALVQSSSVADPQKVFEFLQREALDPKRKDQLLGGVLENMAMRNSEEAIGLLAKQSSGSQKVMSEGLTHGLLSNGEQSAIEWAQQQSPGPILDGAAGVIAFEVFRSEPRSAMEWLSKISDPAEKAGKVRQFIQRTQVDALATIQEFLPGAGLGAEHLAPLNQLVEDRLKEGYTDLLIPPP